MKNTIVGFTQMKHSVFGEAVPLVYRMQPFTIFVAGTYPFTHMYFSVSLFSRTRISGCRGLLSRTLPCFRTKMGMDNFDGDGKHTYKILLAFLIQ